MKCVEKKDIHIVKREDVYMGLLIHESAICRGMLFTIDKDGLANDLIYTTPTKYLIEDLTPNIDKRPEIIIKFVAPVQPLLRFFDFPKQLDQKDLNEVYKKLIDNDYWYRKYVASRLLKSRLHINPKTVINLSPKYKVKFWWVSNFREGKPHKLEPSYQMIKKKKIGKGM